MTEKNDLFLKKMAQVISEIMKKAEDDFVKSPQLDDIYRFREEYNSYQMPNCS